MPISSIPDAPHSITCTDPADATRPCPICGGLGVFKLDVPFDHPQFGKLQRCPNSAQRVDAERRERLRRMSRLAVFADRTFATFATHTLSYSKAEADTLDYALRQAMQFAANPDGWLVFEGGYGTGKTHLAAAVGNARLERGDTVLFITVPDLLDHLRAAFRPQAEVDYDDLFERVRNVRLLILDDLGVENPSPWAQEKLFQLLNHRHSHRMPTVITTNMPIDRLDGRIASRLRDVDFVHYCPINAPDYRNPGLADDLPFTQLALYQQLTLETWQSQARLADEQANLRNAFSIATDFAQSFPQLRQPWLLIKGGYGTGKTHLAAGIANYLQARHAGSIVFSSTPELLDYLRSTISSEGNQTLDVTMRYLREAQLLVLDDLRLERNARTWGADKVLQLLDHRYLTKAPTILTTTFELEEMHPRLVARLLDTRVTHSFAFTVASYAERRKSLR